MSSSYIHTADPAAPTASSAPATHQADVPVDARLYDVQQNGHLQNYQTPNVANNAAFVQNGSMVGNRTPFVNMTSISHFPASAQEILKRAREGTNFSAGSPEWEAAREKVLKSMASSNHVVPEASGGRSRGRGRGRGATIQTNNHVQNPSEGGDATSAEVITPTKRGRGRGRPRGSRGSARGRSRGGKRKREDDTEGSPSEDESDVSESYTPLATVTKSGRNVNKPSQFNPAPETEEDGETKRRRSYRRGPEFTLCVKCQRGHSPPSNAIVFCDGCNSAYHQWCHDPHIPRDVVDIAEKEWFCGKCQHTKESDSVPMNQRVAGEMLTSNERRAYLLTLSSETLRSLLSRAVELHPTLPIFAPNAKEKLGTHTFPISNDIPSPPISHTPSTSAQVAKNAEAQSHKAANSRAPEDEDPYPDFSNPNNDPPATYPRPGTGPIKVRPTNNIDDLPWLLDDNFEVFSHLINDGTGNLVPVDRSDGWLASKKEVETPSHHLQNGQQAALDHSMEGQDQATAPSMAGDGIAAPASEQSISTGIIYDDSMELH